MTTDDRARSRDEEEAKTLRLVFFVGLVGLPWLWIAALWRYRKRFNDRDAPEAMRMYLRRMAIGAVVYTTIFAIWIGLFHTQFKNTPWGQALLVWTPTTQWWQNSVPLT